MTATPPTRQQIQDLADKRTSELGYPKELPASAGDPVLYHEQRRELLDQQTHNARLELTNRYELERDREAEARKREADERAALEAKLKADYIAAAPGTSEADAERALPDLLHRHRLAQLDQREKDVAVAKSRIRL